MKMVINKNKIEIINNENIFEKHLILLYEKNQFGLIDDKNYDQKVPSNDELIEEKIRNKFSR